MTGAKPAGDAALLLETGSPAALASAIDRRRLDAVLDVVPGAQSVLVVTEPGSWRLDKLADEVRGLRVPAEPPAARRATLLLDVVYDGPDLAEVARFAGLSVTEVIARHQAGPYRVGWLGFCPGFGYLTGLDPVLAAVPRLPTPRVRVPAGAVAIAGGLTAVYPSDSPGGWRLIGRSSARLWDPGRQPPALLASGMTVRFRAVTEPTLAEVPATGPAAPPGDEGDIEVVTPGPLLTVQDLGRPGWAHLGVPRCGAADVASLIRANRLVGNPPDAAGLELTLGPASARFLENKVVAVCGADGTVTLRGREVVPDLAHEAPAGSVLRLGVARAGLRRYVAVRGGIAVTPVLGSRSADLASRLGPAALRAGDRLPTGSLAAAPPVLRRGDSAVSSGPPKGSASPGSATTELRVLAGPRDDWFAAGALESLASEPYRVEVASNRVGVRLSGPVLRRRHDRELPSEGMVSGALQVPPDGQPILLLPDHPTTGGYPVLAVVISADLGLAGQLRPGDRVRFRVAGPPQTR